MVMVKNEEAKAGGGWLDVPGWYHVLVDNVEVEEGQYGTQLKVTVECLAAAAPAMVGLKKTEFLPIDGESVGKLWRCGIALGIRLEDGRVMTDDLFAQIVGTPQKPGTREPISFDETQAIGRQCLVRIELYQGKDKTKAPKPTIGFNWHAFGDPRAKDCPIDRETAGDLAVAAHAGAKAAPAPAAGPVAPAAAAIPQAGAAAAAAAPSGGQGWGGF